MHWQNIKISKELGQPNTSINKTIFSIFIYLNLNEIEKHFQSASNKLRIWKLDIYVGSPVHIDAKKKRIRRRRGKPKCKNI